MREFFELFGELCALLSNLEAFVSQILEQLIDKANPSIGGLLINDSPISKKLDQIRALAGYRFAHNVEMENAIVDVVKRIDEIRIERNSFIHGLWNFEPELIAEQKVRCLDPKWKTSKSDKSWGRMRETVWSFDDFRSRIAQVQRMTLDLLELKKKLETATMVGVNSPEELRATRAGIAQDSRQSTNRSSN
jgi:hypothetical protein